MNFEKQKLIQKNVRISKEEDDWLKREKVNFAQLVYKAINKEMKKVTK